jgi:hypothetical protein
MTTFFITFGVIVFLVFIRAIGMMFGRKPIAGIFGGYETLKIECAAGCRNPCLKRRIASARARFSRR